MEVIVEIAKATGARIASCPWQDSSSSRYSSNWNEHNVSHRHVPSINESRAAVRTTGFEEKVTMGIRPYGQNLLPVLSRSLGFEADLRPVNNLIKRHVGVADPEGTNAAFESMGAEIQITLSSPLRYRHAACDALAEL